MPCRPRVVLAVDGANERGTEPPRGGLQRLDALEQRVLGIHGLRRRRALLCRVLSQLAGLQVQRTSPSVPLRVRERGWTRLLLRHDR